MLLPQRPSTRTGMNSGSSSEPVSCSTTTGTGKPRPVIGPILRTSFSATLQSSDLDSAELFIACDEAVHASSATAPMIQLNLACMVQALRDAEFGVRNRLAGRARRGEPRREAARRSPDVGAGKFSCQAIRKTVLLGLTALEHDLPDTIQTRGFQLSCECRRPNRFGSVSPPEGGLAHLLSRAQSRSLC